MEAPARTTVLIVGSTREPETHFVETCEAIGGALARAGYAILTASFKDVTADVHVVRGALRDWGPDAIRVILPTGVNPEMAPEEFRLVPVEVVEGTWWESRHRLFEEADIVLMLGGGAGAQRLYGEARGLGLPVLAVPGLGGFSARQFDEDRSEYLAERVPRDVLESLSVTGPRFLDAMLGSLEVLLDSDADGPTPSIGPVTVLLTWDPSSSPFEKLGDLTSGATQWAIGGPVHAGDRLFVLRQGEDQPGIVGAGRVAADPVSPATEKASASSKIAVQSGQESAPLVDVVFDHFSEHPLISREYLVEKTHEETFWFEAHDGLAVAPELAEQVEILWTRAVSGQVGPDGETLEGDDDVVSDAEPSETATPRAWVETDAIASAGDRSFGATERDSLDAKEQAGIFSALLVARDVDPPLALGLFGDWGVGKTFFMRIMQEKVADVGAASDDAPGGVIARVAQIEFNAWHFVDSDLWASLASRIFDGLAHDLSDRESEVDATRRELRRTIESSQREKREARAAIALAQETRAEVSASLTETREERRRRAEALEEVRLGRVWRAVLAVTPDSAPEGETWPDVRELKTSVERTVRSLGLSETLDSVHEVRRVRDELRGLASRGAALSTSLSASLTGVRLWASGAVVVGLVGLVLAWPTILAWFVAALGGTATAITPWLTPLVQISSVVLPALGWVGHHGRSVSTALGYLEEIEREIQRPRVELAEPGEAEKALEAEVNELDAEVATEERRIEEAERQIAQAQGEIQRIDSGGLVYDFLEGRVRDSRYLDRLGLISVIRQDLEKLGALLRDWRTADGAPSGGRGRPIERIILYIDDLDRCPPDRVVEVLQAVHLLLAFDLFVVVVAVDARWLERALNETYNPVSSGTAGGHRFDAHNYLEKIFQIPFSLPAMDEEGFSALMGSMATSPERRAAVRAGRETGEGAPVSPRADTGSDGSSPGHTRDGAVEGDPGEPDGREADADPAAAGIGPASPVASEGAKAGRAEEHRRSEEARRAEERRQADEARAAEERVRAMLLEPCEEAFMKALFPFLHTPRLAKRFVNIYRLLRVRIASEGGFSAFTDPETGAYRAVLTLLAITVGRPEIAPDLLGVLGDSWKTTLDGVVTEFAEQPGRNEVGVALAEDLAAVRTALADMPLGSPTFDESVAAYSTWAREVGRYSFRWHLRRPD